MLWRNTPDAALLLQTWWDLGAAGCCPTFPHDQTALKHLMLLYAANITEQPWVYPADMQVSLLFMGKGRKDGAVLQDRRCICMVGRHTVHSGCATDSLFKRMPCCELLLKLFSG
jgi:hypothetical protein